MLFNHVTWSTSYLSINIISIIRKRKGICWHKRIQWGRCWDWWRKQEQMKSIKINWMWQLCVGYSSNTYGICPRVTILIIVTTTHPVYNLPHCCILLMWKLLSKQHIMTTKLTEDIWRLFFAHIRFENIVSDWACWLICLFMCSILSGGFFFFFFPIL